MNVQRTRMQHLVNSNAALSSTVLESATHYVFVVALSSLINGRGEHDSHSVQITEFYSHDFFIFLSFVKTRQKGLLRSPFSIFDICEWNFLETILKPSSIYA